MDADFVDLILWILIPLLALFTLWCALDCWREKSRTSRVRLLFLALIVLVPVWGAVIWFRFKDKKASNQSKLMERVQKRRDDPET